MRMWTTLLVVLSVAASAHAYNCKTTTVGKDYMGTLSKTVHGITCQRWTAQWPHIHDRNQVHEFPDASVEAAWNYCRNPDNEPAGPWCYTTDPLTRWQYCDVPWCGDENCKWTTLGNHYTGRKTFTHSGRLCQRWDAQFPHIHNTNNILTFPDASLEDAANYCRNPNNRPGGPWCYTTDILLRWEYCDLHVCEEENCKWDEIGNDYEGKRAFTHTGKLCQKWVAQTPHQHVMENVEAFPDDTLEEAENYCRNPTNSPGGPWCYTTDWLTRWEYCDIDMC